MTEIERARIGVVSDTHGDLAFLERAREFLVEVHGIERAYHLGDDLGDAAAMDQWGVPVLRVPGIYAKQYADGSVPKTVRERVGGRVHLLAHSAEHVPPGQLEGIDVLFVGHTHGFELARDGRLIRVNPGHMKARSDKGRPATCAVVEATREALDARVLALESGDVVLQEVFR
ncbi:MAG: metallophosphoesterase family protein [Planctomycetota bacterium]